MWNGPRGGKWWGYSLTATTALTANLELLHVRQEERGALELPSGRIMKEFPGTLVGVIFTCWTIIFLHAGHCACETDQT